MPRPLYAWGTDPDNQLLISWINQSQFIDFADETAWNRTRMSSL